LVAFKRVAWREVCELAPLLAEVNDVAQYEHPCMLVEVLDSEVLSAVLDVSHTRWPLWFVKLPDSLWPHAQELAMRFPAQTTKKATICCLSTLTTAPCRPKQRLHGVCGDILDRGVGYVSLADSSKLQITRACELGASISVECRPSVVIASYAVNEDEVLGLQVLVAARVRTGVRIESMKKKTSLPSLGAVPAGTFRARNFAGRAVQLRSYSVRPPAEQWCVVVDQIEAVVLQSAWQSKVGPHNNLTGSPPDPNF